MCVCGDGGGGGGSHWGQQLGWAKADNHVAWPSRAGKREGGAALGDFLQLKEFKVSFLDSVRSCPDGKGQDAKVDDDDDDDDGGLILTYRNFS